MYFFNWEPFTASLDVAFTAPSATLVIFLSPASTPVLVMEGPLAIVTPSLLTVVSPVFKEPLVPRSTASFNAYSI